MYPLNLSLMLSLVSAKGLPTVVVVPSDHADSDVVDGVQFVTCPAQSNDDMTCEKCGSMFTIDAQCVVMFKAHGNAKKHVSVPGRMSLNARIHTRVINQIMASCNIIGMIRYSPVAG